MRIPSDSPRSTTAEVAPVVGHPLRRVADAGLRRADEQRPAHERGDGLVRRGGVAAGTLVLAAREAPAVQQRARDELQRLGAAEQPAGDVGRDAVADGVDLRARGEAGRQAREHRRMPEELADAEQVEHPPVEHELDRAGAHHAQVRDRRAALGEDRRARGVLLQLGGGRQRCDVGVVQRLERRMSAQEVGDLGRRGRGQPIAQSRVDGGPHGRPGSACRRTSRRSSSS